MAKSPHYKGDNSGGFGNPPVKSQFKKGNPGGGRPKGSTSTDAAIRDVLATSVKKRDRNGKLTSVPMTRALVERAFQLGLTGNLKANEKARELAATHGPQEPANREFDFGIFTEAELTLYEYLCLRTLDSETAEDLIGPMRKRLIARVLAVIDDEIANGWKSDSNVDDPLDPATDV